MRYLIAYDLVEPNDESEDYEALIDAINSLYPNNNHLQESVWLIVTAGKAESVRNSLKTYIKGKSTLFITPIRGWASWKLRRDSTDWLALTSG
jgi:5'-3' exonuclease